MLRLKKALHGLKQAPRVWYNCIDEYFHKNGFGKCLYEHALYIKKNKNGDVLYVCFYVDDLIFIGSNQLMFEEFKKQMTERFEMTDLGLMSYYFGIDVKQSAKGPMQKLF